MTRSTQSGIWWLHPAFVFSAAGVGISMAAYAIPDSTYRIYWRMPKFFDASSFEITLLCAVVFVFGSFLGTRFASNCTRRLRQRPRAPVSAHSLLVLFQLSFWLCMLGYALWAGLALYRGITAEAVIGILTGEKGAMYDARFTFFPTVGGITTLTEFGGAEMVLGAICANSLGWKTVRSKLGITFIVAAARALLNSERFALIELAVPLLVGYLALRYLGQPNISGPVRLLVQLAPLLGVTLLFIFFTGLEYFRSWTNYYAGRDLSLWEFGAMRLLGYYVTSFSNGAYLLERLETLHAPYFTLHFLWGFPLTGPAIKKVFPNPILESSDKWFYFPFLESGANVEFNNADGMLFPLMDFGVAGGLLYWFAAGAVCGLVYHWFCRKELAGLLLYPILFLGLLEVPLALYWGEGRAFPALCLLLAIPVFLAIARRQGFSNPPPIIHPQGATLRSS